MYTRKRGPSPLLGWICRKGWEPLLLLHKDAPSFKGNLIISIKGVFSISILFLPFCPSSSHPGRKLLLTKWSEMKARLAALLCSCLIMI